MAAHARCAARLLYHDGLHDKAISPHPVFDAALRVHSILYWQWTRILHAKVRSGILTCARRAMESARQMRRKCDHQQMMRRGRLKICGEMSVTTHPLVYVDDAYTVLGQKPFCHEGSF